MKFCHHHLVLSSAALLFAIILLVTIVITSSTISAQEEPETAEEQEHKYRPMIRCLVCENMVKRLIHRMNTTHSNLGSSVKAAGAFRAEADRMNSKSRHKATVSAWAHELVTTENLCRVSEKELKRDKFFQSLQEKEAVRGPKGKIYCEQALEATEDRLIKFAIARKLNNSVSDIDMNKTSEDVCARAKYCKVRGEIKNSMEAAQEAAKQQFLANYPVWKLVLTELKKNIWWYVLLFFGTIIVMVVGTVWFKLKQIRKRIREQKLQEAMEKLKKEE